MALLQPFQLKADGICSSCNLLSLDQEAVQCLICEESFHAVCTVCPVKEKWATKTSVTAFKAESTKPNFRFLCETCLTDTENNKADRDHNSGIRKLEENMVLMSRELKEIKNLVLTNGYSQISSNCSHDYENQHEPVDEVQVRMLLPSSNCGAVIGKGGTNLARFRSENDVFINLVGDRSTDRVLIIIGNQENCLNVINEIVYLCPVAPYTVAQNCAVETNLLIVSDLIGHLVGKGGSKLKEIREQSDSKIKIYPDCMPGSNERVVAVGGKDQEAIINALRIILNTVEDKVQTQDQIFYDPIQHNQQDFGYNAPESISNEFLLVETETNIKISDQICGAIIGKQGMRIREIRNVSGAKITFSNTESYRIVNITGSQQQVQAAELLMTQAVRSSVINSR